MTTQRLLFIALMGYLLLIPVKGYCDDSPQGAAGAATNTNTRWSENGAQALYDGSVFVTGVITEGKFIEAVAASTPVAPITNHFRVFYSSSSNSFCTEDSTGTINCLGSSTGRTFYQLKSSHTVTAFANNGTAGTFFNTTVGISITPTVTTSTMVITVSGSLTCTNGSDGYVSVCKNGSNLTTSAQGFQTASNGVSAANIEFPVGFTVTDFPNSTSAQSYFVCISRKSGGDTVTWNKSGSDAYMTISESK